MEAAEEENSYPHTPTLKYLFWGRLLGSLHRASGWEGILRNTRSAERTAKESRRSLVMELSQNEAALGTFWLRQKSSQGPCWQKLI